MANSNADLDELAHKAANVIRSCRETGKRVSVAAIARQCGAHKNQVHRRLKSKGSGTTQKPVNCKLSAVQEASLLSYICTLDEIRQSICLDQVSYAANLFFNKIT
jgi:hypothetical protein